MTVLPPAARPASLLTTAPASRTTILLTPAPVVVKAEAAKAKKSEEESSTNWILLGLLFLGAAFLAYKLAEKTEAADESKEQKECEPKPETEEKEEKEEVPVVPPKEVTHTLQNSTAYLCRAWMEYNGNCRDMQRQLLPGQNFIVKARDCVLNRIKAEVRLPATNTWIEVQQEYTGPFVGTGVWAVVGPLNQLSGILQFSIKKIA